MRSRHILIVLTLLIGLGAYTHQAEAVTCPTHGTCESSHEADLNVGHCFCAPWDAQLTSHCSRPDMSSQWLRQVFVRPDFKSPRFYAPAFSPIGRNRIPILNRTGPPRRPHQSDSPLSYPIYLRTLTLLC